MRKSILACGSYFSGSFRTSQIDIFISIIVAISTLAFLFLNLGLPDRFLFSNSEIQSSTLPEPSKDAIEQDLAVNGPVQNSVPDNKMLQFVSGQHVLGFLPDKFYVGAVGHAFSVEFLNARNVNPEKGNDPSVPGNKSKPSSQLEAITYPDLWNGVTLVVENRKNAVAKSTYYIAPHGTQDGQISSPSEQIRLRYSVPVRLDQKGNLVMSFATGEMIESAPVAWQEIDGKRIQVEASYKLLDNHEIGFNLLDYNPLFPLVIDPELVWNTFMGATGTDHFAWGIELDINGNLYVAGYSDSTWGSPVNPHSGSGNDIFLSKLNNNGLLLWNTFMGSTGDDQGVRVTIDDSGNAYVVGLSANTWGSPVNLHSGGSYDAFAAKFDSSGGSIWNTFLGSGDGDYGRGIVVDTVGNVYVSGGSETTWGSPVNGYVGGRDAFAAKLNNSGVLQWNTFLGSAGSDYAYDIKTDTLGNLYITGYSAGTWGTPLSSYTGGQDAFVAKLNNSGISQWNTFMGSSLDEEGNGIALDSNGNVYVTGYSYATWGTPVNPYVGDTDAFVIKLNNSGISQWNTFVGSTGTDQGRGLSVDRGGYVHVIGYSPATWGSPINAYAGGARDTFVAKFNNSGVLVWSTFMGSAGEDAGYATVVDRSGNIYTGGESDATWGTPVNGYTGGIDGFAAKISGPEVKAKTFYFQKVHNIGD